MRYSCDKRMRLLKSAGLARFSIVPRFSNRKRAVRRANNSFFVRPFCVKLLIRLNEVYYNSKKHHQIFGAFLNLVIISLQYRWRPATVDTIHSPKNLMIYISSDII